ncbi:hypothetical protein [Myroides odoratimimus]
MNLFPTLPLGYSKQERDIAHVGLVVYNTNENLSSAAGKGV